MPFRRYGHPWDLSSRGRIPDALRREQVEFRCSAASPCRRVRPRGDSPRRAAPTVARLLRDSAGCAVAGVGQGLDEHRTRRRARAERDLRSRHAEHGVRRAHERSSPGHPSLDRRRRELATQTHRLSERHRVPFGRSRGGLRGLAGRRACDDANLCTTERLQPEQPSGRHARLPAHDPHVLPAGLPRRLLPAGDGHLRRRSARGQHRLHRRRCDLHQRRLPCRDVRARAGRRLLLQAEPLEGLHALHQPTAPTRWSWSRAATTRPRSR